MYIHVANTDFEFELATQRACFPLEKGFLGASLCWQLQFLPLLYAHPDEKIAVTHLPSSSYIEQLLSLGLWKREDLPSFVSFKDPSCFGKGECLSWGFSKRVQDWAMRHDIFYKMPPFEVVLQVNSKAFSFQLAQHQTEASLLWNEEELRFWLKDWRGTSVLKTCFGLSGKGNRLLDSPLLSSSILSFCQEEWRSQRPILAEPWLQRIFDFSTQWHIQERGVIQEIGATVFESDAKGVYRGTMAGEEKKLFGPFFPFLEEHRKFASPIVQYIADLGFFGFFGIDAFIYQNAQGQLSLYPVVEINGRRTMSLAALLFQKKWFPQQKIRLSYQKESDSFSLLPLFLGNEQNPEKRFSHHLECSIV